jgi:hypothetical protein
MKVEGADAYEVVVNYLIRNGWRREEKVSGWWMKDGTEDMTLGAALEVQLDEDSIDQRVMLPSEPLEFWGGR